MINGFGICINFSVKSYEDFCWLFLLCVHKSNTHCIDSNHSAFKYLLLPVSEASFLPLIFACKNKNLLPFSQVKLFLKYNSVKPQMLPHPSSWWAEKQQVLWSSQTGKKAGEGALQMFRPASHVTLQPSVHAACWVSAGSSASLLGDLIFLNGCLWL